MPIYRAKRKIAIQPPTGIEIRQAHQSNKATGPATLPRQTSRTLRKETQAQKNGKKTVYAHHFGWGWDKSTLGYVISRLGLPKKWQPTAIINERVRTHTPKKPLIVLDWGCGDGTLCATLATEFASAKNIRFFGYSDRTYEEWANHRDRVTFLFRPKENLPRYFKPKSIGFIIAHLSFVHLKPDELKIHLSQLKPKLEENAFILTDKRATYGPHEQTTIQIFEQAGFKLVAEGKDGFVFQNKVHTKIKNKD